MERPELLSRSRTFGGTTGFYRHQSEVCKGEMKFSVFVPPQAEKRRVPVVYFLSGLTCTEENFITKAGAQQWASQMGLMLVAPDTSPRNTGIPGATSAWDFGEGAGFYVNATQAPWKDRFRMYDYVTAELPALVHSNFPSLPSREGIMGHSMGGHGALVAAFRQPGRYLSVSAFAPIGAPSRCPWGQNAFTKFLGPNTDAWKEYDASLLVGRARTTFPILVDQGSEDKFLKEQLMPDVLREACEVVGFPLNYRLQMGYDHSFYFVQSFIGDHLRFHGEVLNLF